MKEVILCKYGEIILKGANKSQFESLLLREVRRRAAHVGQFEVSYAQSTVCIAPLTDEEDMEEMFRQAKHVFGFVGITRAAVAEKTVEEVAERIRSEIRQQRLAEFKPDPYSDFLEFYRTDPLTALRGIDWLKEEEEKEAEA